MRFSEIEQQLIRHALHKADAQGRIYLFGSRMDEVGTSLGKVYAYEQGIDNTAQQLRSLYATNREAGFFPQQKPKIIPFERYVS